MTNKLPHWAKGKFRWFEKQLIREMAEKANLKTENERLRDGSLIEYYEKTNTELRKELATLKVQLIRYQVRYGDIDV